MKLKMNQACDLSSISVLPPHSRRTNPVSQPSTQLRSQSQSSFSQGNPLSQFSQSSFEETLTNDRRLDSQEREKSSKKISSLHPVVTTQDESQLQLSRTSNIVRRWGSSLVPDNRCQVSEELENRFRHVDNSLDRLGMILDSVQSDVMQVNRAVKEVALETEGVRQKIALFDNSMQQLIKQEKELKAFLDASLKAIPNQIADSDHNKLHEVASTISILPKQIEAHFVKLQHEVCMTITKKIEVIASGVKSSNIILPEQMQSPKIIASDVKSSNIIHPEQMQSPKSKCYIATRQSLKSQRQNPMLPSADHLRIAPSSNMEAEVPKTLKPKFTGSNCKMTLKQEYIPLVKQGKVFNVIIDSDEESNGGLSCLVKKETGKSSCLIDEEARVESIRILREARKRKRRKQHNFVILD